MLKRNNIKTNYILSLAFTLLICSCSERPLTEDDRLISRAEQVMEQYPDSAFMLLQSVKHPEKLSEAQRADYYFLLVQMKGQSMDIENYSDTIQYVINYFVHEKDEKKVSVAYFYRGRMYQIDNNSEAAIKSYLKAMEYNHGATEDKQLSGFILYEMGRLYQQQGNYAQAMENYRLSQQYFIEAGDEQHERYANKYIAGAFLHMAPMQPDSAIIYYHRALEYALSVRDTFEIAVLYKNISLAYGEKHDSTNEKTHMLQALRYSKDNDILAIVQRMLAEIYANANRQDSALYHMKGLMENPAGHTLIDDRYYNHILLCHMYKKFGNCGLALSHYEKAQLLADSIQRYKVDQSVFEIQQKYNKEEVENQYNQVLIQRLTLIIVVISITFLGILAGWFLIYRIKRKENELLESKQALQTFREMLAQNETKLKTFDRELSVKEEQLQNYDRRLSEQQQEYSRVLSEREEKSERLRNFLMDRLDIARKVAQMNVVTTDNTNEFMRQFHKVFGHNMLDWGNIYPVINDLYGGFVDKIIEAHPNIGGKDLQLCCFVRAGFRTEELAVLLSYTQSTVRGKKTQLVKKMGFDNAESFLAYLMEI